MFINFAHRGASSYAPENTFAAFCMGFEMGANGIETDVQRSSDGVLMLHHDDTLRRTAGIDKKVSDCTEKELRAMDFGRFFSEKYRGERMVSLEDFLRYFGGKPLHFAIEIKQEGIELDTLALLDHYLSRKQFTVTSFLLDSVLLLASQPDPPNLGYLAGRFDQTVIGRLSAAGVGQYCPYAPKLNEEEMSCLRARGFDVRAWGVSDESVMRHALRLGVGGMTVNFPDKLAAALRERGTETGG